MRYGVLADVHGNLPALQAVLAEGRRAGVDAWLCAGDLVGYGPEPDACVELLQENGVVSVAGNHELLVLGRLDGGRCTPTARDSTRWTQGVLREDTRQVLERLPLHQDAPGLHMTHGSPDDVEEYVRAPARAQALLDALPLGTRVLVVGHTHLPWVHSDERGTLLRGRAGAAVAGRGERLLVNPGSVGQSRDGSSHARMALLDVERGEVLLRTVPYDVEATRAALRRAGRPTDLHHVRTNRTRMFAGRVAARLGSRG